MIKVYIPPDGARLQVGVDVLKLMEIVGQSLGRIVWELNDGITLAMFPILDAQGTIWIIYGKIDTPPSESVKLRFDDIKMCGTTELTRVRMVEADLFTALVSATSPSDVGAPVFAPDRVDFLTGTASGSIGSSDGVEIARFALSYIDRNSLDFSITPIDDN